MAEATEELYYDPEEQKQLVEEETVNDEDASSLKPDSLFLFELNLALVIASLSLSNTELSESEEDMEKVNFKEQQHSKALASKHHAPKRGFDELKISDRRATQSRFKTIDSRHGRKM